MGFSTHNTFQLQTNSIGHFSFILELNIFSCVLDLGDIFLFILRRSTTVRRSSSDIHIGLENSLSYKRTVQCVRMIRNGVDIGISIIFDQLSIIDVVERSSFKWILAAIPDINICVISQKCHWPDDS